MKKHLLLLLALTFPLFLTKAAAQAVIKFETTKIDFGTFTEGEEQKCTFEFTNTGDKPLVINQAFASCGCTVPHYTQDPIQPGQKGQISVTYKGDGKPAGPFTKVITVRSNATNSLERITISGTMKRKQ